MDRETDGDFNELMAKARSGDPEAVRAFLGRFEREVQLMVRARLPRRLRPRFDSLDFVQAVWKSFFTGEEGREPAFANEAHLRGYLEAVVRNKVREQHRRLTRTARHDLSREEPLYIARGDREVPREVAAPDPTPSERVQVDDRMAQLTAGFGPREVLVLDLLREGRTRAEIAGRLGVDERSVRRIIERFRARLEESRS